MAETKNRNSQSFESLCMHDYDSDIQAIIQHYLNEIQESREIIASKIRCNSSEHKSFHFRANWDTYDKIQNSLNPRILEF